MKGVYRFGVLAFVSDQKELAQRLFLEIVNKIPTVCYPVRLQSLRVLSLLMLNKMGVAILASGKSIEDELIAAVSHSSGV